VAAGASAVQVGTATFNDPTAPVRVLHELTDILVEKGYERLSDVVGAAHGSRLPARPTPIDGGRA
jgi:dihydroorotate dehydrogenase (NAD+) catalytic subunit